MLTHNKRLGKTFIALDHGTVMIKDCIVWVMDGSFMFAEYGQNLPVFTIDPHNIPEGKEIVVTNKKGKTNLCMVCFG